MAKRYTTKDMARRAEKALGELELSVITNADKQRVHVVRQGMKALDDEQAGLKGFIDRIIAEYDNPNAPDDDCARLVRELRVQRSEWPT